jgi:peptidyl-prolyl cis-trans isomerase B (cyclophilin B)
MVVKRGRATLVVTIMMAALFCAAAQQMGSAADKPVTPAPPGKADVPKAPKAIIKTKFGDIEIKFFPDLAPRHVENFIKLAKSGFYNGTTFHRVVPNFVIQGGDPNTKDPRKKNVYGTGGPGWNIKAEFNETPHKRGIVSMARGAEPDSAGSQFFIVVEDALSLDRKYTVFGYVTRGMGVADKIVNLPADEKQNANERVEMTVVIVE